MSCGGGSRRGKAEERVERKKDWEAEEDLKVERIRIIKFAA